jgi:hypothetical protein
MSLNDREKKTIAGLADLLTKSKPHDTTSINKSVEEYVATYHEKTDSRFGDIKVKPLLEKMAQKYKPEHVGAFVQEASRQEKLDEILRARNKALQEELNRDAETNPLTLHERPHVPTLKDKVAFAFLSTAIKLNIKLMSLVTSVAYKLKNLTGRLARAALKTGVAK